MIKVYQPGAFDGWLSREKLESGIAVFPLRVYRVNWKRLSRWQRFVMLLRLLWIGEAELPI